MKKLFAFIILFTFSGSAMENKTDFWTWFLKNQTAIESFKGSDDIILEQLLEQLHQYNEHLFFEISTNFEERELVITAEGDSEQFDSVRNLIAKAPIVKNWKFTAFRPPLGFDFKTEYAGVEYDPQKLWFFPLDNKANPSAIGIRIGIPNFDEKVHIHSKAAAWIVLDTGLGELAAAQDIQYMDTGALPADPEQAGYIELSELPQYIIWKKSKIQ